MSAEVSPHALAIMIEKLYRKTSSPMLWQTFASSGWVSHISAHTACAAQVMAFGKTKKGNCVGMKTKKNKNVPQAATVAGEVNTIEEVAPVEQQRRRRKSAKLETPPHSPIKARVPPSQDKIKMNAFAACAREFMRNAHGYSLALKKMEKEHLLKQKLFRAKLNKIGKLGSKEGKPHYASAGAQQACKS